MKICPKCRIRLNEDQNRCETCEIECIKINEALISLNDIKWL